MADQLLQQQQEYVEQSHQVNNELIAELMNLGWISRAGAMSLKVQCPASK